LARHADPRLRLRLLGPLLKSLLDVQSHLLGITRLLTHCLAHHATVKCAQLMSLLVVPPPCRPGWLPNIGCYPSPEKMSEVALKKVDTGLSRVSIEKLRQCSAPAVPAPVFEENARMFPPCVRHTARTLVVLCWTSFKDGQTFTDQALLSALCYLNAVGNMPERDLHMAAP